MTDPTTPTDATGTPTGEGVAWADRAARSLQRYRVMAWITGAMLLVLCVEMVVRYGVGVAKEDLGVFRFVPQVHGFVYIVYLVTVLDLWSTMRWTFGRLVTLVLAGVVPVLSFVAEHRFHRDGTAAIEEARAL